MARFELLAGGEIYSGWLEMKITRKLEQASSEFDLTVSERWPIEGNAWQIFPGTPCEIRLEGELVLTGYVDAYEPSADGTSHGITCKGRSKTMDFVDCSVTQTEGQFVGLTPGELTKLLAQPFGIEVVIEKDGDVIADAQVQQGEKCFALVERLVRLQELLVTDDAQGRLVLTRAGANKSSSTLVQGVNLLKLSAKHDNHERFSDYIVKAQRPANRSYDDFGETGDALRAIPAGLGHGARFAMERAVGEKRATAPKALTQIIGTVKDDGVTRYRPLVIIAEGQADDAEAAKRADWEMRRRLAKSKVATVSVVGWRQEDGRLWQQNEMIWIRSKYLGLDQEMLIGAVSFSYGAGGEITDLELTLPDAFLPDPKRKTKQPAKGGAGGGKGDGGSGGDMWKDVPKGSGGEA
jgi:prophage tail gpP-like protein